MMSTPGGQRRGWEEIRATDRSLVAACLAGDEAAWTLLWERYGPLVKAIARRVGADHEESREVLQRVALVALEKLGGLRDRAKLAGWLAGVARLQTMEVLRQRRGGEEVTAATAVAEPEHAGRLIADQQLALLRRAFLGIDPRCQRLLQRLELSEPPASYQAVAEAEGLSPTSIGPIRRRCLERLRKAFERVSRR
jgi:RNA polymerase sigma factor (sigma-70 family)